MFEAAAGCAVGSREAAPRSGWREGSPGPARRGRGGEVAAGPAGGRAWRPRPCATAWPPSSPSTGLSAGQRRRAAGGARASHREGGRAGPRGCCPVGVGMRVVECERWRCLVQACGRETRRSTRAARKPVPRRASRRSPKNRQKAVRTGLEIIAASALLCEYT